MGTGHLFRIHCTLHMCYMYLECKIFNNKILKLTDAFRIVSFSSQREIFFSTYEFEALKLFILENGMKAPS